jgi:hypothetical protein
VKCVLSGLFLLQSFLQVSDKTSSELLQSFFFFYKKRNFFERNIVFLQKTRKQGEIILKLHKTTALLSIVALLSALFVLYYLFPIKKLTVVYKQTYTKTYKYAPYGYQISYPGHMRIDDSLAAVRTKFFDETTQIEVYYDDFHNSVSNSETYIGYGNRFINDTKNHRVEKDERVEISGLNAHLLKWERDKLQRVENDKHYYVSAEIVKSDMEVYTILIKSAKPIENEMELLNSFRVTEKEGTPAIRQVFKKAKLKVSGETRAWYERIFMNGGLKWGIYEPTAKTSMDTLHALEKKLDFTFDLLVRYQSLDKGLPLKELQTAYKDNKLVELTMQTMFNGKNNTGLVYDILNGTYDEFLTKYAKDIKAFGHPVLFRLNNEMNGDWVPYSSYHFSKDTDIYVELWKYFHTLFRQNGVDNVLWVWNPNHLSKPDFAWNHALLYYPGDDYVDIIGMTAYNTGTYYSGEEWTSFDQLYAPLYAEYSEWFPQPLMITEFGSSSIGGDKTAWVNKMFKDIRKYPKIKAAVWWSHVDYDPNKNPARIYKLDETEELADTFKKHLREYK